MDQERSEVDVLRDQLEHQRNMTNNAHATLSHVSGELVFWKKLALSQLGVDSQKVNELVQYGGFGGLSTIAASMPSTLRR